MALPNVPKQTSRLPALPPGVTAGGIFISLAPCKIRRIMRQILFLLSSSRRHGNSERLARRTAPPDAQVNWVDLASLPLPPFEDLRPRAPKPHPVLNALLDKMRQAQDIVFVAPIYWYALPAPAKLMMDHWSGFLDQDEASFRQGLAGKRVWLITARADPKPDVPDLAEAMLRQSVEWLGMVWGGALHGVGNAVGEVETSDAWSEAPEFLTFG